jgi:2-methylcitrate dehydratase
VQPALVLGGLRWLGYGDPILSEAVLTTAIPVMPIVAMFALEYRVAEALAASSLFFSRDQLGDHAGFLHRPDKLSGRSGPPERNLPMTQVEALAKYAARASFSDLSPESRKQLPVHILDSLGCCIAALGAGPVEACRAQVTDFGGAGPCALIGGGKANPVYAAFWHTALVRYVDFMDNFLAPTETCHTADNFGVALTAAEYAGGSGRDLMLGVALAYTVQSRLVDHGNFMTRGFDHTAQLAFSLNAAAGRLLGLSESQIAHAIAMAASSDASFAVIRAKPLSQWKGLASAQSTLGAMNTLFLARRGVQGPLRVIEGPNGIDNLLHMQLRVDWDEQGYEGVVESTIKKYNAQIHTQSAIQCMIELVRQNKRARSVAGGLDPGKVVSIEAEVPQITYDFTGGGHYGVEKEVRTKEQADHSLAYMLAVALLDGNVMPAQFAPDRIIGADVQSLMKKVSAKPNQEYTDEYPRRMPAKITVRLQDGTTFQHEVQDYPGLASHPFTWEDEVEKFDQLVAGRIDDAVSKEIKDAVRSLESIQVSDLMALLGRAKTLT